MTSNVLCRILAQMVALGAVCVMNSCSVFTAVEEEPKYDDIALARRVQYPDMARRNGIEGQVLVAALISESGAVETTQVIDSDNEMLNDAAVKAVLLTTFTPAKESGQPVRAWVKIPITFRLRSDSPSESVRSRGDVGRQYPDFMRL